MAGGYCCHTGVRLAHERGNATEISGVTGPFRTFCNLVGPGRYNVQKFEEEWVPSYTGFSTSASRTAVTRLAEVNCTAETLTATLSSSGQRAASSQARRSTHGCSRE